jgi:hypothetical protein
MTPSEFRLWENARPGGGPYVKLFIAAGEVGPKLADMMAGSWNGCWGLLKPGGSENISSVWMFHT